MQERIQKLQAKLELKLEELSQVPDPIQRYDHSIKLVSNTIEELKAFITGHTFGDKTEEVYYFKSAAPLFYSKDFYFIKVYELELLKRTSSKESLRMALSLELKEIDLFFSRNGEFCRYYYIGSTLLDEQLFSRHNGKSWPLDNLSPILDANFCLASYKISWIIANEKYRVFLEREIHRLDNPDDPALLELTARSYRWKATKADATEIIDAWEKSKIIEVDGADADAKDIADIWKMLLHCDLGNYYEKKRRNLLRKKDNTPFLNSLILAVKAGEERK